MFSILRTTILRSLADVLLGRSRAALLSLLFGHADEWFHLRQIARESGMSAGTAHRELGVMVFNACCAGSIAVWPTRRSRDSVTKAASPRHTTRCCGSQLSRCAQQAIAPAKTSPDHAITLQALPLTLGVDVDITIQLDAYRRKRNLAAYEGDDSVSEGDLAALFAAVTQIKAQLIAWLKARHPEFL